MTAETTARISACGRYRYDLTRRWGEGPMLVWIMLNPSTADATQDDATIRKVRGFTERLGGGGFVVVNLFAWRARSPEDMKAQGGGAVGVDNDATISRWASSAPGGWVIAAWGTHGGFLGRDEDVARMVAGLGVELRCLVLTGGGAPGHPVMLGYDAVAGGRARLWRPAVGPLA